MIGKFGVGCCCDSFCLWSNPAPWSDAEFIDWYEDNANYKRYKLGSDNKYTIVDNQYLDAAHTQQFHFDNWMERLEFDSNIAPSDSNYFTVSQDQVLADLNSLCETFASRHYDNVPNKFIYLFVINHNGLTREPKQYLIPVHAGMERGTDFASLYLQAIANCKMPGPSGATTRATYYDFFALIVTVTTRENGTKLWLNWDNRCLADLCSRIVSWDQQITSGDSNELVGHKTYERVTNSSRTWNTVVGQYSFIDAVGVECDYYATIRFNPIYSGICWQKQSDNYGNVSWFGPWIPDDKLQLFDKYCKPQWGGIIAINNYRATGIYYEPTPVIVGQSEPAPHFDNLSGTIAGDSLWLPANYTIRIDHLAGHEYDIHCLVTNKIIDHDNRYTAISQAAAEERAEKILDEIEQAAQSILGTPIPPPPDVDYYSGAIRCEGSACTKQVLYRCDRDYRVNPEDECGSLAITTTNLAASAAPCKYAKKTNRKWLTCANCRTIECRSPILPKITDAVAVHTRLPVDKSGTVIADADYIEVRSAYCNSQSCSSFVADV